MPGDIGHRAFFGDAERDFRLTSTMILELERLAGAGIGALFNRVLSRDFLLADVAETIRLGLIGGGCAPQEAARLVTTYVTDRPFAESYPLALDILTVLWTGRPFMGSA